MMRWLQAMLAIGAVGVAAPLSGEEKPPLTVTAKRGEVQARFEDGAAIIDVTSGGGIGSATLRWASPKPMNVKQVKVRLRYGEAKPFVALEGFSLRSARLSFQSSLGTSPEVELIANADGVPPPKFEKPLKMPIIKAAAGIEISLPLEAVKDFEEFTIHWVDYYRG
jgi:hypothetical protein